MINTFIALCICLISFAQLPSTVLNCTPGKSSLQFVTQQVEKEELLYVVDEDNPHYPIALICVLPIDPIGIDRLKEIWEPLSIDYAFETVTFFFNKHNILEGVLFDGYTEEDSPIYDSEIEYFSDTFNQMEKFLQNKYAKYRIDIVPKDANGQESVYVYGNILYKLYLSSEKNYVSLFIKANI